MKKLLSVFLMLTLTLTMVCMSVSAEGEAPALAYPELAYGELLYSNTFDVMPEGTQTGDGTLAIENGALKLTATTGDFWYTLSNTNYGDKVIISVDAMVYGEYGAAGLSIRKDGANGNSGYDVNWLSTDGLISLIRPYQGQNTRDESFSPGFENWYNITVVLNGASVELYGNGVKYSTLDTSLGYPDGTYGTIGFDAYVTTCAWDNLYVYALGEGDAVAAPHTPVAGGDDAGEGEGTPDTSDALTGGIVLAVVALSVGVVASKKRFGR